MDSLTQSILAKAFRGELVPTEAKLAAAEGRTYESAVELGTTHEQVSVRWEADRFNLQPLDGRLPYPYIDDELRKVARDAYVSWHGSRYSVPWTYAGKQVWVCERGREIEVRYGRERIAIHGQAPRRHTVITEPEHHRGIPLGARQERKTLIHIQDTAPVVEIRPLAAYESAAIGGVR